MKLTEFNMKQSQAAKKALKEHFNTSMNLDNMGLYDTKRMLGKVKGLLSEMKQSSNVAAEQNPAYLKAVFMEQALSHHYGELKALPMYNQRVVLENEEVQKSQVVLAAQEMVDSMQKMIEQVSDMLVKELPAVVDGVNAEIGTNEGEQFNTQAAEALTSLQAALTQSQGTLKSALGVVTGEGGGMDMGMGAGMGGNMGAGMGDEMGDMGMGDEMSDVSVDDSEMGGMPEEEPEAAPTSGLGRATR
jgi:hypothetical protein